MSMGMAKPTPAEVPVLVKMAVFTPITRPCHTPTSLTHLAKGSLSSEALDGCKLGEGRRADHTGEKLTSTSTITQQAHWLAQHAAERNA